MYSGKIVFSQIMDNLPIHIFHRCVKRYDGNRKVHKFKCLDQYYCMAFAQLTYRESLRDIEACLRSQKKKLYHMGIRGPVSRNTLANANKVRDWRIYADFANALNTASEQAYKVVANPVEGTMLTVIREVSEEALSVSGKMVSFGRAIVSVVRRARETVKRTPEMLTVLKEAGVVDAGAKGLFYFFKGMENAICRKNTRSSSEETSSCTVSASKEEERHYGFDVQFLIEGKGLPVEEIRKKITSFGECPLVVGDEELLKVHVHTMNPDEVLNYARDKGILSDIIVEDMDLQVQEQTQKKGGPVSDEPGH